MLPKFAVTLVLATPVVFAQSPMQSPSSGLPSVFGAAASGGSSFLPLGVGVEGDQPMDVVMALGGTVAVVALRDSDSLEFYAVASGARLGDVTVAGGPVDLDPTPDGTTVFVACAKTGRVCVVDVATRTVTASIPCARGPFQVAALSDNRRAIVACDSSPSAGTILTIDRLTSQVIATTSTDPLTPVVLTTNSGAGIQIPTRNEFAVTPDDATIAVPSMSGGSIELYDATTLVSTWRFASLATPPFRAVASPDSSFFAVGSAVGFPSTNRVYVVQSSGSSLRENLVSQTSVRADVAITLDSASILYGTNTSVVKIDVVSGQVVASAFALANDGGNIEIESGGTHAIVAGGNVVTRVDLTNFSTQIFWQLPSRARIAVHPTSAQVVAVAPLIDEDITSVDLNGAPFGVVWDRPLGVPEEIDAPQEIELTADGERAVVTCSTSGNVAFVDLDSGALLSLIDVDGRCVGLAVSPIADLALVCVTNRQRVDVIDLVAGQIVQSIPTPGQPQFVFFSPDGSRAVVAGSSTGSGEVEFFDVTGNSLASTGRETVQGVLWSEGSLSPDGTKLAFVDFGSITLIDTAAQSTIAVLASPQIAKDGHWSPDSSRFAWSCNVIQTRIATVNSGTPTVQIYNAPAVTAGATFGPNSTYLYQYILGDYLQVVELSSGSVVAEVLIGPAPLLVSVKGRPRWFQAVGDQLLVVRNEAAATICRIQLAGPATTVLENVAFPTEGTADVAFDLARGRLVMPASIEADGIRIIQFGGEWTVHCGPATPNSTGLPGSLRVEGSLIAGSEPITLKGADLPRNSFSLFIVSRMPGVSQPASSQGTLCLSGSIRRLGASLQTTGMTGTISFSVAPNSLPLPGGPAQAGESLYFQAWFRDANPTVASNFTDGVRVSLR